MALVENRRFAQFAQNYAIRVSDFVRFFPRGQRGLTVPGSAVWASEWESDRRTSIAKTANELAAPVGLTRLVVLARGRLEQSLSSWLPDLAKATVSTRTEGGTQ